MQVGLTLLVRSLEADVIFALLPPPPPPPLPNSPKNQNFKKKNEKKHAEISAFYTSVTKNMITCTVPEIWCVTD